VREKSRTEFYKLKRLQENLHPYVVVKLSAGWPLYADEVLCAALVHSAEQSPGAERIIELGIPAMLDSMKGI
jgi:hypothetical protein